MISSAGRLDACRRLLDALRRNLSNESCQIILPQSLAIETASQFLDFVVVDIVFVAHQFVNSAIRRQFNDAVGNSVDKLMVVAGEEDVSLVELQIIVECLDAFHIQVVGRRVKNQQLALRSCILAIIQRIFSPPDNTFTFLRMSSSLKSIRPKKALKYTSLPSPYWLSQSSML